MRAALLLVLLMALASDARAASLPWTHTRPTSSAAADLLRFATGRSTLVRELVEQIERTDVVVMLVFSTDNVPSSTPDFMSFLAVAGVTRFVSIHIHWRPVPIVAYVPLLAHELQHALELASAPDVRDQQGYARLFGTIGWRSGTAAFETARARATETRVRQEIARGCHGLATK